FMLAPPPPKLPLPPPPPNPPPRPASATDTVTWSPRVRAMPTIVAELNICITGTSGLSNRQDLPNRSLKRLGCRLRKKPFVQSRNTDTPAQQSDCVGLDPTPITMSPL